MDIRQIIRLHIVGKSQRQISTLLNFHRRGVSKYLSICSASGLAMESILELDDGKFNELFGQKPGTRSAKQIELEQYLNAYVSEHKHTGFTIENHFRSYMAYVADGLGRSQFYNEFQRKFNLPTGSVRLEHSNGQKLFLDFTGKHLHIIDAHTGERKAVEVFVGILPASQYIYVKATVSQCLDNFIDCTTSCLDFIGGVPASITTDNLKSAVTKASKTEPVLNKSFKDLAYHYGTTINPTRAYSPKDKALVEGAVRIVYCSIFYALRHQHFFDLASLNKAIQIELSKLNARRLSNKVVSRLDQYKDELPSLGPLPVKPFELWDYKSVKVQKMGYVFASKYKNYYSIPYRYIGKQIQLRSNNRCIEAYYDGDLIATHLICLKPGQYITIREHLHSSNQFYLDWSPAYFANFAKQIGIETEKYVSRMIALSPYPETAYKSALAIIALKRLYPVARIEKACELALDYDKLNCQIIKTILENNRDLIPEQNLYKEHTTPNISHENIRGGQYFAK